MSAATSIEWTRGDGTPGATWNPVTGCAEVSQGCDHCYATHRVKALRDTPAELRFLSLEPLLGPLPELPAVEQRGRIERQDHHPTNGPQAS